MGTSIWLSVDMTTTSISVPRDDKPFQKKILTPVKSKNPPTTPVIPPEIFQAYDKYIVQDETLKRPQ